LRHGIIGAGGIVYGAHSLAFDLPTTQVVGLCDILEEPARERAAGLGVPFYTDYNTMVAELKPDVAVIITPHYCHAKIAIACLEAGCHVLVEKPMALEVAEADAMVAAARETDRTLAVVFQNRHRAEVRAARRLIAEGRLGKIQRLNMITSWPRTARYYGMATWRATWWGEGGGVLMNQSPHDLDLVCHLMGSPSSVLARVRTRLHHIPVEDTASALVEWPGGAIGHIHVSTAEGASTGDIEIVGTGGTLRIGSGMLDFQEFETDAGRYLLETDELWHGPALHPVEVELEEGVGNHTAVYRDLHAAILNGTRPASDGVEGRMSLELANAIIYSSYTRSEVAFPVDRARYAEFLAGMKGNSDGR
jgi:predicted dehydrogenase